MRYVGISGLYKWFRGRLGAVLKETMNEINVPAHTQWFADFTAEKKILNRQVIVI